MKKLLASLTLICIFLFGCYKTDPTVVELLKQIQNQNDALKVQVAAMQKSSDSIAIILKASLTSSSNTDKKIDSIRTQLGLILTQINLLNTQLVTANSNLQEIQIKLATLQATCDQLLKMLIDCCTPSTLNDGLVAYFPFNGNANDESGYGNNGTIVGAVLTNDRFNAANRSYYFPGKIENRISVPNNSRYDFTSSFSISLWAYFQQSWTFHQEDIIYKGVFPSTSGWNMGLNQDNAYGASNYSLVTNLTKATGGVQAQYCCNVFAKFNNWHHYVLTYNKQYLYVYFDGIVRDSTLVINPILNNTYPITIGGSQNPVSGSFNRSIDDVRIYNRSLSQHEISYLSTH